MSTKGYLWHAFYLRFIQRNVGMATYSSVPWPGANHSCSHPISARQFISCSVLWPKLGSLTFTHETLQGHLPIGHLLW